MTYKVLARKLRPQVFQDVIGQSHVIRVLQNSLIHNKLGHAYLFCGTRGVGKTTLARIFAKSLRCENISTDGNPCNKCRNCVDLNEDRSLDVLEIDGASNNGVENIRDLVSNIQYLPTSGKYKIYIIDEVHMLSIQAFNALLKTLEEPPEHALFIFATTEPQKLLPTVLSRCQRFDFKSVLKNELCAYLKKIAIVEDIKFQDDVIIEEICQRGNGSVRDTLSLLEQLRSFSINNEINEDTLVISLGMARNSIIKEICYGLIVGNPKIVSRNYVFLLKENVEVKNIFLSILNYFFNIIENIDDKEYLNKIDERLLESTDFASSAELFFIYEMLAQDSAWLVNSLDPENVGNIVLKKIACRRSFFVEKFTLNEQETTKKKEEPILDDKIVKDDSGGQQIDEKDYPFSDNDIPNNLLENDNNLANFFNEEIDSDKINKNESVKNTQHNAIDSTDCKEPSNKKNWDDFLAHLYKKSPALASNLEQGNILKPITNTNVSLSIDLGFGNSEKVFLDYIEDHDILLKLKNRISEYYKRPLEEIIINLILVDETKKKEYNFQSKAEIQIKKELNEMDVAKNRIISNEMIKEAKNLFGSSIDKVILNDRRK